jgi:hypothetical protein
MKMIRFVLGAVMVATIAAASPVYAQKEKVVEKSSRRKPDWIGRSDKTHFAVTEQAATLSAATDEALASVRQYIVGAVAVNISSTEQMTTGQISRDEQISITNEYSSKLVAQAAGLPYLNDITLSNAEDIYWEKIYDRKTGSYRYEYSVLYPFSEQMRAELVNAFMKIDRSKQALYDRLRRDADRIADLDGIGAALVELDGLEEYFFDAGRKKDVETLKRSYRLLYNRVSIEVEAEEPGRCVWSLVLDGRRVVTSHEPRLVSTSAIEMRLARDDDNRYVLTYNPEYASPRETNTIDITYIWGGARVSRTIYFDPE